MGHTATSQRIIVQGIISELKEYGKSLRKEDKPAFDRLIAKIHLHIGNISYASSYNTWAFVLFSILLEQEKKPEEKAA
jgi:hypothetical protein